MIICFLAQLVAMYDDLLKIKIKNKVKGSKLSTYIIKIARIKWTVYDNRDVYFRFKKKIASRYNKLQQKTQF